MSSPTVERERRWHDLSGRDLSIGALGVTVVLWASAFVGIRDAADSFSAGPLSRGRHLVAADALTVMARPWRHRLPSGRALLLLVLAGVSWFGAYNVALNAGEQQVDAGTAALVVTVGPILIALFAGILLKEGFPKPLLIGIAIAASGVVLISLSTRDESAVARNRVARSTARSTPAGYVRASYLLLRMAWIGGGTETG